MSVAKLQNTRSIYKNELHVKILATKPSEIEILKIIPFIITLKNMKYLRVSLKTHKLKIIKHCQVKLKS